MSGLYVAPSDYEGPIVYVVQAGSDGPLKIGKSTTRAFPSRLSSLQTGCASSLRVRRTYMGGRALERELHRRFASARLNGEWFANTGEVRELYWPEPVFPEEVRFRGKVVIPGRTLV